MTRHGITRQGKAWNDIARKCMAWQGKEWHGMTWKGKHNSLVGKEISDIKLSHMSLECFFIYFLG
jgi:hypothetical protein